MCFTWQEKWEKFGDVLAEKKLTLSRLVNSDMIKPEKFDHLHLVYHFTALSKIMSDYCLTRSYDYVKEIIELAKLDKARSKLN